MEPKSGRNRKKEGRLGNREYFQIVEGLNALQRAVASRRGGEAVRATRGTVAALAREAAEMVNGRETETALRQSVVMRIPLAGEANEGEWRAFLEVLRGVAKCLSGLCVCWCTVLSIVVRGVGSGDDDDHEDIRMTIMITIMISI